jgi:hypothetical protein
MSSEIDASCIPALEYVRMLKERDYIPRPLRKDAQSGREVNDMNMKTNMKKVNE